MFPFGRGKPGNAPDAGIASRPLPTTNGGRNVEIKDRIAKLDEEIQSIEEQIRGLQQAKRQAILERDSLRSQQGAAGLSSSEVTLSNGDSVEDDSSAFIDYFRAKFPWSGELLPRAKDVWGIHAFRSVQEAVCNAAIDGRDVVCVMPTGGGKSLCYQLPAIISVGLTLVISPLISLSMDQMWHLREVGVSCAMMSSADSREETNSILRRVKEGRGTDGESELKVLFVTPERVAKSKSLLAALQKCYERERLSRIVIDEAHCCSQMGHDFRPDYKQLSILRKVYPSVPMLCLSATLAPKVLDDVRSILDLPLVVDPAKAPRGGTVYFTAPLHRPNLHYAVVSRPSASKEANQAITDWILSRHPGKSGIVYAHSRADTQKMAEALQELSHGKIKAAVYNADLDDDVKTKIHHRWREGSIHVVVATIAFGMGIDKGDVRFVLHASLGKSLDSYYQETGRAGRDGLDADCVLFYRPTDAARVSGLLSSDPRGQKKLHSMLEYVQSINCRKSIFGGYFQDRFGDDNPCGVCDNCVNRPEESEVTLEAWKLLRVLEEVYEEGGRITYAGLCDLARGLGGGQYTVIEGNHAKRRRGKRSKQAKQSGFINLAETITEKVQLSKDDAERLLVELLLQGYVQDEYNATAYVVNVYARPGPNAQRLTRLSREAVEAKQGCPSIKAHLGSPITGKPKKKDVQLTPASGIKRSNGSQAVQAVTTASTESDLFSSVEEEPLRRKKARNGKPKRLKAESQENEELEEARDADMHVDGWEVHSYHGDQKDDDHACVSGTSRHDAIEIDSD